MRTTGSRIPVASVITNRIEEITMESKLFESLHEAASNVHAAGVEAHYAGQSMRRTQSARVYRSISNDCDDIFNRLARMKRDVKEVEAQEEAIRQSIEDDDRVAAIASRVAEVGENRALVLGDAESVISFEVGKKLGATVRQFNMHMAGPNRAEGEVMLRMGKVTLFADVWVERDGRGSGFENYEVKVRPFSVTPNGVILGR